MRKLARQLFWAVIQESSLKSAVFEVASQIGESSERRPMAVIADIFI